VCARTSGYALAALLAFFIFPTRPMLAQAKPADAAPIPLTVAAGVPLHIELDQKVRIKHAGAVLEGQLVEPVYVFDHLVIPAGSKVQGRVTKVDGVSRKRRALAIANGDFTPSRTAHFEFNTLVLPDGTRRPLNTAVSQGEPPLVRLEAGGDTTKKRGRVRGAVEQAKEQAKQRERQTLAEFRAPGKMQRLKAALSAELPYHRQVLPVGTHFTAELKAPLEFGKEEPSAKELEHLGAEVPPGSVVQVRLLTPLSSATARPGSPVQAVVSAPLFSSGHQLILPQGARLEGRVVRAVPARRLGRNGRLRFIFQQIELRQSRPQKVEASLQEVDATSGAHVKLDSEGGAHAVAPKTRFIMPAIDVLLATSSLDGMDGRYHHGIRAGVARGPDVAGGAIRGAAGLGLAGSVIGLVAHYRPISAGFAFYGAAWSVYSHVVARGTDVVFPKNTPMQIRFGTHEGPKPPATKSKSFARNSPAPVKPS
jgi:hypothetical protein